MSFSSQFFFLVGGVSKIFANVTEGIRGGHHKSFNDKKNTATAFLSAEIALCH